MPTEIVMISMLRALIEVAGLMLLIRGTMWLLGRKARDGNFVYDILTVGATPFVRLTRLVTPGAIRDSYIPVIAFLLLLGLWIALGMAQHAMCVARGVQCV